MKLCSDALRTSLLLVLLTFAVALLPAGVFAQRRGGNTLTVSTNFNYHPPFAPYHFFQSSPRTSGDLILTFLTRNSGTFVIEEGDTYEVEEEGTYRIPSNLVGIGASFQIWKDNGLFQDFSLTKLSFTESAQLFSIFAIDDEGERRFVYQEGVDERSASVGLRYEVGKYFGERRRYYPNFRFGLSGGVETSFYAYRSISRSILNNPIKQGHIFTVEVSLIPVLSFQPGKRVLIDFKAIPNFLVADFGNIQLERPDLPISQRNLKRSYDPPIINVSASLMIRYLIKEPKRGRRSRD